MIYLDYNATTPVAKEVAEAMQPYLFEYFGNPSSSHWYGQQTKKAVEQARERMAKLLNCKSEEIVFTSGGSESNNYALKGYAFQNKDKGRHIITSKIEHPAIIEVCKFLEQEGFEVSYLPVDETGRLSLKDVEEAIRPDTILISVMYANNEVGTLQPLKEISALAKKHNIAVHSDCAQAVGKVPVDVKELGVDLLTVAGHKFYGPKGIGALYVREGMELQKLIHGADHEMNRRAGTENILEVVGLGKAAELAMIDPESRMERERNLIRILREGLEPLRDCRINGNTEFSLPNTLSISFKNLRAADILAHIPNIAASAGAACHSDAVKISVTLDAMNVPFEYAMGTLRLSVGKYTSEEEIVSAIEEIKEAVSLLRE
ncbi:cysteine desulfurase family protein [Marinifilum sp. D714]|uniref:cysteine desulfurase family protein n=1 Tax=Marinifilum sp. D714 TaxID=2937523 RepID=UPI0027C19310|nr:cysteine desulfurase family protein [Marinifilum sp. D714]MDQ2178301.1 cysteine desulfurase [Marinifilum sp. D714]